MFFYSQRSKDLNLGRPHSHDIIHGILFFWSFSAKYFIWMMKFSNKVILVWLAMFRGSEIHPLLLIMFHQIYHFHLRWTYCAICSTCILKKDSLRNRQLKMKWVEEELEIKPINHPSCPETLPSNQFFLHYSHIFPIKVER